MISVDLRSLPPSLLLNGSDGKVTFDELHPMFEKSAAEMDFSPAMQMEKDQLSFRRIITGHGIKLDRKRSTHIK